MYGLMGGQQEPRGLTQEKLSSADAKAPNVKQYLLNSRGQEDTKPLITTFLKCLLYDPVNPHRTLQFHWYKNLETEIIVLYSIWESLTQS